MVEITAEALESYFKDREPRVLIGQLKRGELDDPMSILLAEGLKRVIRERDVECFTLPETWRFATRSTAARSRIVFLKEHGPYGVIVDASCGIGLMLRELATLPHDTLIGIEIDPVTAQLARANLALFGVRSQVHTIDATCAEGLAMISGADLVFCDPERAPTAPSRSIDENTPAYRTLAEHAKRLVYEVSPLIMIDALPEGDVIELYSEKRRHARTTLYHGFPDTSTRRVVSDRSETLSGTPRSFENGPIGSGGSIELLDPTVVRAGLAHELGASHMAHTKHLRFTDDPVPTSFIDRYRVIGRGDHATIKSLAQQLFDFNRIALRYPVPPGSYWREANSIRKSSTGARTIHVFRIEDDFVLAEPMP
jgi:hypothetical protein